MTYKKIYKNICERGKSRLLVDVYTEDHHIIPRCMGGDDTPENITTLTAREHFLCHWLLIEMYPKSGKLKNAFWFMINGSKQSRYTPSARIYEYARISHVNSLKGKSQSAETIKKMIIAKTGKNHPMYGKTHSDETKKKIGDAHRGKTHSDDTKQKMSNAQHLRTHSDETKKKIGDAHRGKVVSEETKQKMRESRLLYLEKKNA